MSEKTPMWYIAAFCLNPASWRFGRVETCHDDGAVITTWFCLGPLAFAAEADAPNPVVRASSKPVSDLQPDLATRRFELHQTVQAYRVHPDDLIDPPQDQAQESHASLKGFSESITNGLEHHVLHVLEHDENGTDVVMFMMDADFDLARITFEPEGGAMIHFDGNAYLSFSTDQLNFIAAKADEAVVLWAEIFAKEDAG